MIKVFKALNYLVAALFIFAAIVQYNDPDSLIWVLTYGLAATVCILWARDELRKAVPIIIAVVALGWSAFIFPGTTGQAAFSTFSMQSIEIEEMRESLGLVIMAVWMLLLAFIPQKEKEAKAQVNV